MPRAERATELCVTMIITAKESKVKTNAGNTEGQAKSVGMNNLKN